MMDRKTFETRLLKIINLFGAKNYSQDRINLIYDVVKNIAVQDFDRIINHFIGDARYAPLVKDFQTSIGELGIKRIRPDIETSGHPTHKSSPNYLYHIRENIWANDDYVFIRPNTFIIKSEHPGHPYVLEDANVREARLKEVAELVRTGQYANYSIEKNSAHGMRRVNFKSEIA